MMHVRSHVSDLTDTLSGNKYFTTLDLASGYWRVPVEKPSKEKTSFENDPVSEFSFSFRPRIQFAFVDINCRLGVKFADGSLKFFSSESELEKLL